MKYGFRDFMEIIEKLRGENGCPWDREQTHESLRPCMIEEAYELVSSIRIYRETGSPDNLREELGDVLLQVAMHSQIAGEEGLFTIDDVIQEVSEKMVRRHPHVFGQAEVNDSDGVLKNWEEIKSAEKAGKDWVPTPLREIPRELPSLIRGVKVQKKIGKLYADGTEREVNLGRLESVTRTLEERLASPEIPHQEMEQAFGEALLELTRLAAQKKVNLEQALDDKIEELIKGHGE